MSTMSVSTVSPTMVSPRMLVRGGVIAGPLFVIAGFAQIPFREGFDLTRHAFSFLLIGPGGWLQATVFLSVGLLYAGAGPGLRRVLGGRAGVCAAVFAVGLGLGMIIAGLFAPQPSFGYPIGTPQGPPAVLTTSSVLHGVGFGLGVLSLICLLITLGVALRRRGRRRVALLGFVSALLLPVVPATSAQPFGTVLLYVIATSAYVVVSVALASVLRAARS